MKDEMKPCATCKHEHAWGILRYSKDNVPLYNARPCATCSCDSFVEAIPGNENLPAMSQSEIKEIWAQTEFLNAQVPLATRLAVSRIMSIGEGGKGFWATIFGGRKDNEAAASLMERQWPEFMGLMISQLTDLRGAMFRDESKFAHLVAHTDEIVEAMRGVVQLSERLSTIVAQNERMAEHIAELQGEVAKLRGETPERPNGADADNVFAAVSRPLRDEPIVADSRPSPDSDDSADESA